MRHAHQHVTALQKKHAHLDRSIRQMTASPAADERELAQLKREKLHLKDEIEKLLHDA